MSQPHTITCLIDALRNTQDTIRSYDTKAQIMGILFILSVNFLVPLVREMVGGAALPATALLTIAALVLVPLCLFGFVLYPANNPADSIALGRAAVRHTYFVHRRPPSLEAYLGDVAATDWETELGFEIMKLARLRESKRRRLLRALVGAGVSYALILALMLILSG